MIFLEGPEASQSIYFIPYKQGNNKSVKLIQCVKLHEKKCK